MADNRRLLDVWIVETNTVYKQVPFTVVADWVQQGRLLEDDMLRPAGSAQWGKVGAAPDFRPYLPHAEPNRAEDKAEALEAVQLDFNYRRRSSDEDDDVDMIPLIDISLVLLIFFMMTASAVVGGALIQTPETFHSSKLVGDPEMIWVGIDLDRGGSPVYSLGEGTRPAGPEDLGLTEQQLLAHLDQRLERAQGPVRVRVAGHNDLTFEVIQSMTAQLERRRQPRNKIEKIEAEVRGKNP